jgi:hypothetical protein
MISPIRRCFSDGFTGAMLVAVNGIAGIVLPAINVSVSRQTHKPREGKNQDIFKHIQAIVMV